MKIVFQNQGEIDPRSIKTFGVNSKESKSAIGYFGTGLKYAIAVLLRKGCHIEVWSGMNHYTFSVAETQIRHGKFDIIKMNDEELGFTTELGKNWDISGAYRELYCNCTDEEGEITKTEFDITPLEGFTTIIVWGDAIEKAHENSDEIILDKSRKPLFVTQGIEVYQGSCGHVYYKGVNVGKLEYPTQYTYNILVPISLTEDRTAKHSWEIATILSSWVVEIKDSKFLTRFLTVGKGTYENYVDINRSQNREGCVAGRTPHFFETCKKLYKKRHLNRNRSVDALVNSIVGEEKPKPSAAVTELDLKRIEKAKEFIATAGYDIEYPIVVTDELDDDYLGLASDDVIYITKKALRLGQKEVTITLLEEYVHLKFKVGDFTREMQNVLFNLIIDAWSEIQGEIV